MNKVLILMIAALALTAAISAISYAVSASGSSTIVITPLDTGEGENAGAIAEASTFGANTFSIKKGKAHKINGVGLYKLTMGAAEDSDNILIELIWMNANEAHDVLHNPHAAIYVRPFFEDSDQQDAGNGGYSGDCDDNTQRLIDDGGNKFVCPDDGPQSFRVLTREQAVGVFKPVQSNADVWYLIADIMNGSNAPPAQQNSGNLEFGLILTGLTG
jgi:hypothetical protein